MAALIVSVAVLFGGRIATRPLAGGRRTERGWLLPLLKDADGWPSLARFQLLLWTVVVAFAVLWVSLARLLAGLDVMMPDVPVNLLGIIGIGTIATPISSLVSNEKYTRSAKSPTAAEEAHKNHWRSMLLERGMDGGHRPALTRLQMFLWTCTGVVIYFLLLLVTMLGPQTLLAAETLSIPDLGQVFVGLMGISQVGYIGGKAATKRSE